MAGSGPTAIMSRRGRCGAIRRCGRGRNSIWRPHPTPLVEIPQDTIPPHLPSVAQAKLLLREGVREPMVRTLTEIAIIEGFGATIRELPVPPLSSFIREGVAGTALSHLTGGLFEAHARDEAGWGEEGGHKQMWEAARDLALSNPKVPGDILMAIMGRRGGNGRGRRRCRSSRKTSSACSAS